MPTQKNNRQKTDAIILGAGAAGLFCAIHAARRGRKVLVLDHANKAGKKILMSGGGRCNFTNYNVTAENFISHNPHFCKSALSRYTQWDFIALVQQYGIAFHEKTLGQLFCDNKSKDIVDMLLFECQQWGVELSLNTQINGVQKIHENGFKIKSSQGDFYAESLVVATGGLSIPTMGASPMGYEIAKQFGVKVWPTRAGLVALTLQPMDKEKLSVLSGIAVESHVSCEKKSFFENILFTHRGLSGPAILQISSYWQGGEEIKIDLLPNKNLIDILIMAQQTHPQKQLNTILAQSLPKKLIDVLLPAMLDKKLQNLTKEDIYSVAQKIHHYALRPSGTEGYRTAEVTLGGVDCDAISSKTMQANDIPGLYFIGEVLDVTGWLGGYNFQWAWSSGWAAGQVV